MTHSAFEALARAARRLGSRRRAGKGWPNLLFFTDPRRTAHPAAIAARLPRGCGIVFRTFGARTGMAEGLALARIARRRGLVFFVGADWRLAAALRADGVHLPEHAAGRRGHNLRLRRRFLLSAAAHDEPAARRARLAGVQALVISPVFASASPSAGRPMGSLAFARLVRHGRLPTYALGGVHQGTAPRLARSGAAGLAAIDAFERPLPPRPSANAAQVESPERR